MTESLFIPVVFTYKFRRPSIRRTVTVRCELTREDYARWITDVAFERHCDLPEARARIEQRLHELAHERALSETP